MAQRNRNKGGILVTPAQKENVYKLRLQGLGYKAIARELLLSADAVKSYCKRHHLNGPSEVVEQNVQVIEERNGLCPQCKQSIRQKKRGRSKRFCSDTCRYGLVLGYKCGHKNVESVKLKARKDVSNIEQAVYRRIQSDGR